MVSSNTRRCKEPKLTIGLDLGDRTSHYCILDEAGSVILEHSLPTTPKGILQVSSGIPRSRIALETGTHSPWVSRQLTQLGHEVIVAWVLSEAKDIVPIPGTKRVRYLEENMGALDVTLTENDPKNIAERLALIQVIGERYAPDLMALSDRA